MSISTFTAILIVSILIGTIVDMKTKISGLATVAFLASVLLMSFVVLSK